MGKPGPWADRAACAGMDTDIFFNADRQEEARNICLGCPVVLECAEYAIENETEGFWGGLSPRQREDLRE